MSVKPRELLKVMKQREQEGANEEDFAKLIEKELEMYNDMTPVEQRKFDRELRKYEEEEYAGKSAARKTAKSKTKINTKTADSPSIKRVVKNITEIGKRGPKLKF